MGVVKVTFWKLGFHLKEIERVCDARKDAAVLHH